MCTYFKGYYLAYNRNIFFAFNRKSLRLNAMFIPTTVESLLFVRDQCSWISRVTINHELVFLQTYNKVINRLTNYVSKEQISYPRNNVPINQKNFDNSRNFAPTYYNDSIFSTICYFKCSNFAIEPNFSKWPQHAS